MVFRFPIFLLALHIATQFSSASTITLPLGGVYRAGRYTPVLVTTESEAGTLTIMAAGALDTSVAVQANSHLLVPWLTISENLQAVSYVEPSGAQGSTAIRLRALSENDRLVGLVGTDAALARPIFPEAHIIPIDLGPAWNPKPAAAWESLDAVIADENSLPGLLPALDTMLSAGTTIAVKTSTRPAIHSEEWTRSGPLWLLHREPMMAHNPINPEVYAPTYDWVRGRTPVDRARVLILAIVLGIAVVGIALWRNRWAIWLIVAVCIGGMYVVFAYDRQRPRMLELRLGVASSGQLDAWTWYSPISAAEGHHPFTNLSKPVFATRQQGQESNVVLNWSDDLSQRNFTFYLGRNQSLAFVDILPAPAIGAIKAEVLPDVKDFADHLYIKPGDEVAGTSIISEMHSLTTVVIDHPRSPAGK